MATFSLLFAPFGSPVLEPYLSRPNHRFIFYMKHQNNTMIMIRFLIIEYRWWILSWIVINICMTRAWDKEKIWVPDRNRSHDLPNIEWALYPLSYENSWRARSFDWVHMTHTRVILINSPFSLRSKRFRGVQGQRIILALAPISRGQNTVPWSFFALQPQVNACHAGYSQFR